MRYSELVRENAPETDIRAHLAEGEQVSVAFRIPKNLRDGAKEAAELQGMSLKSAIAESAWLATAGAMISR